MYLPFLRDATVSSLAARDQGWRRDKFLDVDKWSLCTGGALDQLTPVFSYGPEIGEGHLSLAGS